MAMNPETKRQAILLGVLGVCVVSYVWFGGYVSFGGPEASVEALPSIDAATLERNLKAISTVDPSLILVEKGDSVPDRNLFQYGVPKPPPVDPAELERRRLAEQKRLEAQEAALRAQKAREQQQQQQQQQQPPKIAENRPPQPPPKPAAPPKPTPPPITFRLMGVFGPETAKIGVFLEGDNPPLLAKKGEIVQQKFRILDIGVEWADVGYVDPQFQNLKKRIDLGS